MARQWQMTGIQHVAPDIAKQNSGAQSAFLCLILGAKGRSEARKRAQKTLNFHQKMPCFCPILSGFQVAFQ
jgi:hypothetical protein